MMLVVILINKILNGIVNLFETSKSTEIGLVKAEHVHPSMLVVSSVVSKVIIYNEMVLVNHAEPTAHTLRRFKCSAEF